jgi:hypothetical protein
MIHLAARAHAFVNGLFRPHDATVTRELYDRVAGLFAAAGLTAESDRIGLAQTIAADVLASFDRVPPDTDAAAIVDLVRRIFDYEQMFVQSTVDWAERKSVSQYWELRDELNRQRAWLEACDECSDLIRLTLCRCLDAIWQASPDLPDGSNASDGITVPTERLRAMREVPEVAEAVIGAIFDEDLEAHDLFARHRKRFENNLIVASGGNPADPARSSERRNCQASRISGTRSISSPPISAARRFPTCSPAPSISRSRTELVSSIITSLPAPDTARPRRCNISSPRI